MDKLMDRNGTHDFIKFPPQYGNLQPRVWFLLGEIQAKLDVLCSAPIPPAASSELRGVYLQRGVHATTAIEGNSFSEEEVKRIIAGELIAPPSLQYQQTEVENMLHAFNAVAEMILAGGSVGYDLGLLNELHTTVLGGLETVTEGDVRVGDLREHTVTVGRYVAPPAENCPQLLRDFCDWLNNIVDDSSKRELALLVVEAIAAHVYFNWIHPYGDGNGRMARLIEFAILLEAGVPDIAAQLLSNHYHKTRDRYYYFLQESHGEWSDGGYAADASLEGFLYYALEGFRDGLDEQLTIIEAMQMRSVWRDEIDATFVREFGNKLSPARQRQKRLLLDLSDKPTDQPVTKQAVAMLSAAQARAYVGKSLRTIARDLNALEQLNLLKRVEGGHLPNYDILRGFRARSRANDG